MTASCLQVDVEMTLLLVFSQPHHIINVHTCLLYTHIVRVENLGEKILSW